MSLLQKASIITTPTAYAEDFLYSIKPAIVFGDELVTNGDFSGGSANWTAKSGVIVSADSSGLVFDNSTGNSSGGVYQNIGLDDTRTYQMTATIQLLTGSSNGTFILFTSTSGGTGQSDVYVGSTLIVGGDAVTNTFPFTPASGDVSIQFSCDESNATYKVSNISVKEIINADFDFTRASTATRVNEEGLIEEVAINTPRIDFTGGTGSILLEPSRTNSLPFSNDFSNAAWSKEANITATYNTTETLSPDGTYNASKFVGNGTDGLFDAVAITGIISRSVYLKSVTGTVTVVLKDPYGGVTAKSLTVTEEWQRFELVEDNGGSSQGLWIDDIPASGIYMYGAQIEAGSYTTSYIPTNGTTVTRSADAANNAGNSDLINSTEGVLYAEIKALANDGVNRVITIVNSSSTLNRIRLYYTTVDNRVIAEIRNSSGGILMIYNGLADVTTFNKFAVKYKNNDAALWVNGTEVLTDTTGGVPTGLNKLVFDDGSGSDDYYGDAKSLMVFKEALTDEELTKLTS